MVDESRPAMEYRPPPKALLPVMNAVFKAVLGSPLHRVMSGGLMVLHVPGRKTGRVYDIVVGRHDIDGQLACQTDAPWRRNLRDGSEVEVTVDGRRRRARVTLVDDPEKVAELFSRLLAHYGYKKAYTLGMTVNVDRMPTLDEVRAATATRVFILLTLLD